jgi:hypothetical protein
LRYIFYYSRHIRTYPNGDNEDSKGNIGLFLNLESATSLNFLAKWSFSVLNAVGVRVATFTFEYKGYEFKIGSGRRKFMTHSYFDTHLNNNNGITFLVDVSVLKYANVFPR